MRKFVIAAALIASACPTAIHAQGTTSFTVPGFNIPGSVPAGTFNDKRRLDVLAAQVLLDRSRFSPGVIDGMMGSNTSRAVRAYQKANGLPETGKVDYALLQALQSGSAAPLFTSHVITAQEVAGPFVTIPGSMTGMAKLDHIGFETPVEMFGEKFHMTQGFLQALNPGADFGSAGTQILVIAAGDETLSRKVTRIEVDKADESVRAFAEDGKLLARYPATIGSSTFPSPSGSMEVRAVAPKATYHFSPDGRSWGPDETLTIAAGPNNPVGGVWIDLTKEGYGIHGTPDPKLIGKTASHGCVRLTNWDAQELSAAVSSGAKVEFV